MRPSDSFGGGWTWPIESSHRVYCSFRGGAGKRVQPMRILPRKP